MQEQKFSGRMARGGYGLCSAWALTAAALAGSPAHAQQQPDATSSPVINDIVVTARRKEETLQSVPVAITALSGADLTARSVTKMSDITTSVPGVFSAPGSARGSNSPVFAIRGQVNRDPTLTNDPSIGIYFADVPWARPGGTNAAVLDLQSVQVLKGPQGTLFGRNSTAGAILITPNAPTDRFEGYGKIGGGDYGFFNVEGVVNVPLGDGVALRITGNHEQRRGYLLNVTGNQKMDDLNDHSLRASLKFESGSFKSTFIGSWYKSDTNGDGSRLTQISPQAPNAGVAAFYARLPAALAQTNALGKYEQLSSYAPSVAAVQSMGVSQTQNTQQVARVETWSIQNTSQWDLGTSGLLGDVTLKNIVGYRHEKDFVTFETVAVPFLSVNDLFIRQNPGQVSEEFQVQGKNGGFDYIVGAFYFRESGRDDSAIYSLVPIVGYSGDADVTNTSYSAFAHVNYNLALIGADGFSLTGGIRINHDRRFIDWHNRRGTTPGPNPPLFTCTLIPSAPPNDGSLCNTRAHISFTEPTWDVGMNYKIARDSLIYASASHGYRSGGYSVGASNIATTAPFLPEKVNTYEIGSKNDFIVGNVAVRVNVAGYYTAYRDIQRTINFVLPSGFNNLTVNAARAHIWGSEVDITVKPTRNLSLGLSYSYVRPKYDRFTDQYLEPTNGVVYPVDVSDSDFILTSRHSLNANMSYTLPVTNSVGIPTLSVNYYYRTKFATTSDINTAHCSVPGDPNPAALYANCFNHSGKLPGYGLLNMRFEWENFMGHGVDVAIFVNNVTNKYYFPNALNALGALGALSAQIGPPRMFGGSVTVPFGEK